MYTRVLSACPLLGGLSSFGASFIGGLTVLISCVHPLVLNQVPVHQWICGLVTIQVEGVHTRGESGSNPGENSRVTVNFTSVRMLCLLWWEIYGW